MYLIQVKDHRMTSKPSKSVNGSIAENVGAWGYLGNQLGAAFSMEAPGGVEPPTNSLGNCCSIQLSYGATVT